MQKLNIDKEFKDLISPLSKDEYEALEESILREGCRDAIITWRGTIIDGHNRYKICEKHDIPFTAKGMDFNSKEEAMLWMIDNQLGRRNLLEPDRVALALKKAEIYKVLGKENQSKAGGYKGGYDLPESFQLEDDENVAFGKIAKSDFLENSTDTGDKIDKKPIDTRKEAANLAGISERKVGQYTELQKALEGEPERLEEVYQDIREGNTTVSKALKDVKAEKKQAELKARIDEQIAEPQDSKSVDIYSVKDKYDIIYADPPWSYDDKKKGFGGADDIYPTMDLNDICDLPVWDIARKNAVLFMWATPPMLVEAFRVLDAWGFTYKQHFVWDKVKNNLGHYHGCNHEILLIAVKGNFAPPTTERPDSVQVIEKTKHSEKPEEFRKIIETLYPVGKKIELFARTAPDGWDVFGNMV